MDATLKEHFRFSILTRWKLGLTAKPIHDELEAAHGDSAPSFDTVARWIRRFSDGSTSTQDESRSGRPSSSVTNEKIAQAATIVELDRSITLRFLSLELDISYGSAHTIMHEHLRKSKRCARWIPHLLTEDQKAERVHVCQEWLEMFKNDGRRRLSDVVTGDECWISRSSRTRTNVPTCFG